MTTFGSDTVGNHAFGPSGPSDCVELRVPAQPEMWGLIRMAVTTVAALMDMSLERVEDLRIAVNEICTLCAAGSGPDSSLRIVVRYDDHAIGVTCVAEG